MKSGDWVCPKCKNHNFANKKVCNRTGCEQPNRKLLAGAEIPVDLGLVSQTDSEIQI